MNFPSDSSWHHVLLDEFNSPYFQVLQEKVAQAYLLSDPLVFPPQDQLFKAFEYCPWENLHVVILGQDPYHNAGQAHGLSFSVPKGVKAPPSLVNILKEIQADLQLPMPNHANLNQWAQQGVLLMNACLTVEAHQAGSYSIPF